MPRKTSLAWHQLLKEKARLFVAIAGIGFADMLMFVQLGFQDSLYDSATQPHRLLEADLVLVSPQFKSLAAVQSFSRERLYQTLSNDQVQSVSSVYIDPENLSGGQKQRVAIARALISHPKIVLADEPTAALDKKSGRDVVELMQKLAKEQGSTILLVTHDNRILDIADRIIYMEDGRLVSDGVDAAAKMK
jgi:DevC protein